MGPSLGTINALIAMGYLLYRIDLPNIGNDRTGYFQTRPGRNTGPDRGH